MDFHEISRGILQLWDANPVVLVLIVVGIVGFVLLVVDTWFHKHRRRRPTNRK
jgi:hypothetical protein